MNILVFNEATWDDRNSFGNTVSNFFCGETWGKDNFSNFFARKQLPNNEMIVSYYNLSALDIVKGVFNLKISGTIFDTSELSDVEKHFTSTHRREQRKIDKLHEKNSEFIYFGHEQVWRSRAWLNKHFKDFIDTVEPDILFSFATSPYILWPLIQYLKKKTECKVVLFIADDVYGYYDKCASYRRWYLKKELKKCIVSADLLYACSDEMARLYEGQFGKDIKTLYKGCDLSMPTKERINHPLRFVYAGNLLWGRDETLAIIVDVLEHLNTSSVNAVLEIYTGSTITPELERKLNRGKSSKIMGARSYRDIKTILHDADVVLHVESFNEAMIETVRYSFSTKIIDCLQSGSQVLGIGPKELASVEYLRRVDGVIVIDEQKNIESVIKKIIDMRDNIISNAINTRSYALKHHEIDEIQNSLRNDFKKITTR